MSCLVQWLNNNFTLTKSKSYSDNHKALPINFPYILEFVAILDTMLETTLGSLGIHEVSNYWDTFNNVSLDTWKGIFD